MALYLDGIRQEESTREFLQSDFVFDWADADVTLTHSTDALTVAGGDFRIANGNGVVIGHSAQVATNGGETPELQVLGTAGPDSSQAIGRFQAADSGPLLSFIKSRNGTIGSFTIVQSGDAVGGVSFRADDGTDYNTPAAAIEAFVDGTPGANDMPGRLVFSTTADGASSVTERLRIAADGLATFANSVKLGDGGTVTQATSISTGVTLNTNSGQITTVTGPSIAAGAEATFTVTNSQVAATDQVIVNVATQFTDGFVIAFVSAVGSGSFDITLSNVDAAAVSAGAAVINFAVIKGSSS